MTNDMTPEPRTDVDRLASALDVTEAIVAGVRPEQAHQPTPCQDYEVTQLLDHLVGWAVNFADKANGVTPAADPTGMTAGDDPRATYHDAAARLVDGYRAGGEGATPLGVVLMETVTHGWDLAVATGQPTPYPDDAVEAALAAGQGMLQPKYRGEGQPFGDEVEVSSSGSPVDRLVAFMGRDPGWSA
jgi:uncharacterized protein (TIGR03086 family)